jgi:hypothetical protein
MFVSEGVQVSARRVGMPGVRDKPSKAAKAESPADKMDGWCDADFNTDKKPKF